MDIDLLKDETKVVLQKPGRVEAITKLRHRFYLPLSATWWFVDKLNNQ